MQSLGIFTAFLSYGIPLFLLVTLMIISLKDVREGIIPDRWLLVLALLGLLYAGLSHALSVMILGGIGYGLYKLYPLFKNQEGLGFGDVKMMACSGLWLSPSDIPLFFMIGGSGGILIAVVWRLLYKKTRFPLGPALALALGFCTLSTLFSGKDIKMTQTFSGPQLNPATGSKPTSLVIFFHGYGANGNDLLFLGKTWGSLLPNTLFVAPHGPAPCEGNPSGKQWFSLRDFDHTRMLKEVQAITPALNRYLDGLLKLYELPPQKLALVGFSQGAMLALHLALSRPQCGAVVAYSGTFLDDPLDLKVAHPPILLIHGTEDDVLPASFSQEAEVRLKMLGVPVTLSLLPDLEHSIDERGLKMGGLFLKNNLYGESNE